MNDDASAAEAMGGPNVSPWPRVAISDVARTSSGTTPSRRRAERYFVGGTVPWVKTLDLRNGEILATDECVTDLAVQETSLQVYPPGTVLVAMYGGFNQIGRTGLLRIPACINQALSAIQANRSHVVPEYLLAVLNFRVEHWKAVASSSRKDPNITGSDVKAFELALPSVEEQRSIAGALADVDALLAKLDQLIAKERDIKQGAMQQLLTERVRLPGFHDQWEWARVGDFAECVAGGTPSTSVQAYWDGSIRWMASGDLHQKRVRDVQGRISELGVLRSSARPIPVSSVLIGLAGQGKTRGTVAISMVALTTNQSVAAILPNKKFVPDYLFYNLDFRYEELRGLSTGDGGRGGLNLTIIRSLRVHTPPQDEQRAIAQVLTNMDAEIAALEARRDKTRQLKQGMMQALLTGRIRLR